MTLDPDTGVFSAGAMVADATGDSSAGGAAMRINGDAELAGRVDSLVPHHYTTGHPRVAGSNIYADLDPIIPNVGDKRFMAGTISYIHLSDFALYFLSLCERIGATEIRVYGVRVIAYSSAHDYHASSLTFNGTSTALMGASYTVM